MRRMVKEKLLKFDGTPLFPERIAYTVPYKLSDAEARSTRRSPTTSARSSTAPRRSQNDKRAGTVGFALTILQRRLASSPEAIYQSLRRRRERLEKRLRELELLQRGAAAPAPVAGRARARRRRRRRSGRGARGRGRGGRGGGPRSGDGGAHDRRAEGRDRDARAPRGARRRGPPQRPGQEVARARAPARRDLHARRPGDRVAEPTVPYGAGRSRSPIPSPRQKLVIFTEHRDTLNYLERPIGTLLGRPEAVVMIHGGMGREERRKAQEAFTHDPEVQVLVATDAAGEGINLQRAHLMVNYDLPWNPNRLEQRFGRIHRIGQTEVCHLWNLVAEETREGDVYRTLLEKLEEARKALGGQVFDVLGKLQFEGRPLRDLLIEAIRYGDQPEVRARLTQRRRARRRPAAARRTCSRSARSPTTRWTRAGSRAIREEMERAEARRLQPHYIESFFLEAFQRLGGTRPASASRAATRSPTSRRRSATATARSASASRCCRATSASPSRRS